MACECPQTMPFRLFSPNATPDAKGEFCLDREEPGLMSGDETIEQKVTRLFDLLHDPVYYYLLAVLGDPAAAEDITQESFLRLFVQLRRGAAVENVRLYVFRIAHNLACDERRRGQRLTPLDALSSQDLGAFFVETGPNPEQRVMQREKFERLRAGLARLSPQERQCLLLRLEGFRYREVGEILGIGVSTAAEFLQRAMRKLMVSVNG